MTNMYATGTLGIFILVYNQSSARNKLKYFLFLFITNKRYNG